MPNTNESLTKQDLVEVLDRLKAIEETILTKQEFRETIERELLTKKEFQVAIERTLFTKKEFNDAVETIMEGRWAQRFRSLISVLHEKELLNARDVETIHRRSVVA